MTDPIRYFSQVTIPEIGMEGQKKIEAARVLVVGAGGLGCPALSYLTAMGVGTIGIIDSDVVELKNLHRQVLYHEADIGKLKAEAAKEKLQAQNSHVAFNIYMERLSRENAAQIISGYDIIVDCCDNFETRYIIDSVTKEQAKPFVYAAVRRMEGQISVFNYKGGPSYIHLFSPDESNMAEADCATAGIVGYVTGILGSLQVNEVLKIILDDEYVLSGEVMVVDLRVLSFRKFRLFMK